MKIKPIGEFEEICRPIITEHPEAPGFYGALGSSFLVASDDDHFYWVTALHNINNMPTGWLRIIPMDNSSVTLPFDEMITIGGGRDSETFKDIYITRINMSQFIQNGDTPLKAQDVEKGFIPAENLKAGDELFVIGYPNERTEIDYTAQSILQTRCVLRAIYKEYDPLADHLHMANISTSIELRSYNGLSGSAVFYMDNKAINGTTYRFPLLVGMVLQGTASSGIIRFVSSRVIFDIIRKAGSGSL